MHFSLRRWFILPCGLPYARGYTKLTKCLAAPAMTDLANAKKTSRQSAGLSGTHCGRQDSGFFPLLSSTRGTSSHHPSHLLMWNCSHFIFFFSSNCGSNTPTHLHPLLPESFSYLVHWRGFLLRLANELLVCTWTHKNKLQMFFRPVTHRWSSHSKSPVLRQFHLLLSDSWTFSNHVETNHGEAKQVFNNPLLHFKLAML